MTSPSSERRMARRFKTVAVGGTFDEFHKGHRALLIEAFDLADKVLIGLCTDDFVDRMKKPHAIAPFAVRLEELKSFLGKNGLLDRAEIVPLHDPYGPALNSTTIDAIVVSKETARRADEINSKRRANNLRPLDVVAIEMILAENSSPISTTRIRRLEIDREGRILRR